MREKNGIKSPKYFIPISIFILSTFFLTITSLAQTPKIAVFDLQRIMRESKVIQGYRKTLEKEIEEKRKILKDKEDSIKAIEEKLKRDETKLSFDERRRLEDSITTESKELKRLKEDITTDLKKIDRELSQRVLREIGEVIREMGNKEKYSIIFERSLAGVAYFDNSFDITQKIIESYDSKKLIIQ